ncbi:unnamed protein product [Acanthoscelides obtectus]|uniref:Uncharacterized protein n=1 Tax=Acanthoscelides obtectus TaxID=200917 RepID=A0A9P0MD30_ACAOB|nr:unnamed protein product [Acanthoscelides obtectus]CAK1649226.1 hypothetical protein AOBTE_LOCUS16103 [Acanthoscelides obtectus]
MKDLHEEVVMLRESNLELINLLLTNKGAMHNMTHPNNQVDHNKTSVNCNAEETKYPVGNKNKNDSSQKTSNYKRDKPEQKQLETNSKHVPRSRTQYKTKEFIDTGTKKIVNKQIADKISIAIVGMQLFQLHNSIVGFDSIVDDEDVIWLLHEWSSVLPDWLKKLFSVHQEQHIIRYETIVVNHQDLILKFIVNIEKCEDPLLDEDPHHPALNMFILFKNKTSYVYSQPEYIYDYSKGEFYKLYNLLEDVDWSDLQKSEDVNICTDLFYGKLYGCLDQAIPKKAVNRATYNGGNYPIYFSVALKKTLN